ncbi:carotenoid cleavage dioxygenase 7, chloroplastic [Telopea speciosissima]|uniref:carotenoid cleavage dioxygenase 7, chloroplastic n=1 Tax=Telopea speciosissima TaxID=54955 RepID=UPI001CC5D5F9|nr:carotenoid cleavage dioxygenase 7, chloroplastic [Telopea speciosissima]
MMQSQATAAYHFKAIPVRSKLLISSAKLNQARISRSTSPAKIRWEATITAPQTHLSSPIVDEAVTAFQDYQLLFTSQRSECVEPVVLRIIDGSIPHDFPSGTYYLIGPGLFSDDHGSTVHPLDGHGYLRAFTIDGQKGEVRFMARYVETEAQREERDRETGSWRFTHRGPFSVLRGGKKILNTKVMKNVANTTVLKWGKRLLCLWEGGQPYEIEPTTLDTIGMFNPLDGCDSLPFISNSNGDVWDVAALLLKPILYGVFKMPPKRLLSHYKIDAERKRLLILSCNAEDMLLPRNNFTFYEFDINFNLLQKQEFNIPDHLMIHDWAFTNSHYILFGNRVKIDGAGSMRAVLGLSPMISALSVNPSKSTTPIYLLPRSLNSVNKGRNWRVPIEAPLQIWLLHVGNAFEQKDKNGVLEVQVQAVTCSYQWFNFIEMFGYNWQSGKLDPSFMNAREGEEELLPHLIKVSIKLDANGLQQKCLVEPLNHWSRPSDFPVVNPTFTGHGNTYLYASTSSDSRRIFPYFPFDTVIKSNLSTKAVSTWSVGSRRFIGEPVFVHNGSEEDNGYLLVVEYAVSIQKCYLVVLNAKRIGEVDALVARLEVPKHLNFPFAFHGFWATEN